MIQDEIDNVKSSYYARQNVYFTIRSYENLGKSVLVSILDLFERNPFSRIPSTVHKDLSKLRKEIGSQLSKQGKDHKGYFKALFPQNPGMRVPEIRKKILSKSIPKKSAAIKRH